LGDKVYVVESNEFTLYCQADSSVQALDMAGLFEDISDATVRLADWELPDDPPRDDHARGERSRN
jgi:hypothetical protein